MKTIFIVLCVLATGFLPLDTFSQVSISKDASSPHPSAMLDVQSDSLGVLIPRMTEVQRDAILSPSEGLLIYQIDVWPGFYYFINGSWHQIGSETLFIDDLSDGKVSGGSLFLGSGAGDHDDGTDNHNTGFGISALSSNTSGAYNCAIGLSALTNNTSGGFNVAIGTQSLFNNTTGSFNIAAGYSSLNLNTMGSANTAIGHYSMARNTTGEQNSAFGASSLDHNTTGNFNTANGYISLGSNTEGYMNTAIGYLTLRFNTLGSINTSLGSFASYSNTTGFGNTSLGAYANLKNETGNNNTIIGYRAGAGGSNHNKSGNIFLGFEAGYDEISDNKLYIENSAADSSNALIYGDFANDLVALNATVGIGNTLPQERLDVNGAIRLGNTTNANAGTVRWTGTDFEGYNGSSWNSLTFVGDNDWVEHNDNLYRILGSDTLVTILSNGNVGVGKSNPTRQLEIAGSLVLPNTVNADTGVIYFGGERFIHNYTPISSEGNNVYIGRSAGNFQSSAIEYYHASNNIGIGSYTLSSLSNGAYNIAIGTNSLKANSAGICNIGVGINSMKSNTSGTNNISIGFESLQSNTDGWENVALGSFSLYSNTTGHSNIAIGLGSLFNNISGAENIAIGKTALSQNSIGINLLAIGHGSLGSNTIGNENIAIGQNALNQNIDGNRNTAVGFQSLHNSINSNDNTGVGAYCLRYNIGQRNTGIGSYSLFSCTTGSHNSSLGYYSLKNNTSGSSNIAIGSYSLHHNTSGEANTSIGTSSLFNNTEGLRNTGIGCNSLYQNTIGSDNIGIGNDASAYNNEGSNNVSLGHFSNYFNQNGSNNTIVGCEAGSGYLEHSKSGNVFLGYKAGFAETGNNKLYIENSDSNEPLLYGEFDNDILAVNGKLGVGTMTPDTNFHIIGNLKMEDGNQAAGKIMVSDAEGVASWADPAEISDGDWITDDINGAIHRISGIDTIMTVLDDGFVGIGTASPDEPVEFEFGYSNLDIEFGNGLTGPDVTFFTLRSPNGTKFYITVDDSGNFVSSTAHP